MKNRMKYLLLISSISLLALTGCDTTKEEPKHLDAENLIPPYDGSLELDNVVRYSARMSVDYPKEFSVIREMDYFRLTDDQLYVICTQTDHETIENEKKEFEAKKEDKRYKDTDMVDITYMGFNTSALIYNITDEVSSQEDHPTFELLVDYGDQAIGDYDGMIIDVYHYSQYDAYELLKDQKILAILNNIQVMETQSLDQENPIPQHAETLSLTETTFEDKHLILQIPDGMTYEEKDESIHVTREDGVTVNFYPAQYVGAIESEESNFENFRDNYVDPDRAEMEKDGLSYTVLVGTPKTSQKGELTILVDFGDIVAGQYSFMTIKVRKGDEEVCGYEFLKDDDVLALLNTFQLIEGDDIQVFDWNGIHAEFPGRYNAQASDAGINAFYGDFQSPTTYVGILPGRYPIQNMPLDQVAAFYGNLEPITFGEESCYYRYNEEDKRLYVYRTYGRYQTLVISLFMSDGGTEEMLMDYMQNSPEFAHLMETMTAVPEAEANYVESDWDKTATDPLDFECYGGMLKKYKGTDTEVRIPEFINGEVVTSIGEYCFYNTTAVTKVEIPQTVLEICDNAFYYCESLQDITIPTSVNYIGSSAFCRAGQGAFVSEGAVEYGRLALSGCNFTSVTFGEGSDLSQEGILSGCLELKEVHIPEGTTTLGDGFLTAATSVEELVLPESLTTLGEKCFSSMTSLRKVNFPAGLTVLPNEAFAFCQNLSLQIPDTITEVGYEALDIGYNLPLAEDILRISPTLKLADGAISVNNCYIDGVHSPEDLPENFENQHVYRQLFLCQDAGMEEMSAMDEYLLSLDNYSDVTYFCFAPGTYPVMTEEDFEIEENSVLGLKSDATEITIGQYIRVYGQDEFDYENYRTKWIKAGAFEGTPLTALWIGQYAESIETGAFRNCDQLKDIWAIAPIVDITLQEGAFEGIAEDVVVHLPCGLTEEERETVEANFRAAGIPEAVTFDYYSLH